MHHMKPTMYFSDIDANTADSMVHVVACHRHVGFHSRSVVRSHISTPEANSEKHDSF